MVFIHTVASGLQLAGQFSGGLAGTDEDQRGFGINQFQNRLQGAGLRPTTGHHVSHLIDLGGGGFGLFNGDGDRRSQELGGQLPNRRSHGGGEERGLPFSGGVAEDGFHIFNEAHVQHFVGFVQHQPVELVQLQATPAEQIQHPSRSPNHNVDTPV